MKTFALIFLLLAISLALVMALFKGTEPDAMRTFPLCQRIQHLEFIPESGKWAVLAEPSLSVVVCPIPGTTADLSIEGLKQSYEETPLPGREIQVRCFKAPRIESGLLPMQMPDGLYCNIPAVVN